MMGIPRVAAILAVVLAADSAAAAGWAELRFDFRKKQSDAEQIEQIGARGTVCCATIKG